MRRLWQDSRTTAVAFGAICLSAVVQIVIAAGLVAGWWR